MKPIVQNRVACWKMPVPWAVVMLVCFAAKMTDCVFQASGVVTAIKIVRTLPMSDIAGISQSQRVVPCVYLAIKKVLQ